MKKTSCRLSSRPYLKSSLTAFSSVQAQTLAGPAEPMRSVRNLRFQSFEPLIIAEDTTRSNFRFGQCQIWFELKLGPKQTQIAKEPNLLKQKLYNCFEVAESQDVNVLILPELAFALPEEMRREVVTEAMKLATRKKMVIIAGSYYDEQRYNRLVNRW